MPQKTKREKIVSEQRKRAKLLELLGDQKIDQTSEKNISPIESGRPDSNLVLKKHFSSDLLKSLVLVFVIIALEIVIYFGTINKYFDFK